jgi:hypothetical protein
MKKEVSIFQATADQIKALTEGVGTTQAATLLQAGDAAPQALLYTQSAPQGDAILWTADALQGWPEATAQALLQMHQAIQRAAATVLLASG